MPLRLSEILYATMTNLALYVFACRRRTPLADTPLPSPRTSGTIHHMETVWKGNDVISIEYKGGFVFRVVFDDGRGGDVDFSEYIGRGPVFEPLRDTSFFKEARIEGGTISWPNGADVTPETL